MKKHLPYIIVGIILFGVIILIEMWLDNKYVTAFSSILYAILAFAVGYTFAKESSISHEYHSKIIDEKDAQIRFLQNSMNEQCNKKNEEIINLQNLLHSTDAYKEYNTNLEKLEEVNDILHDKVDLLSAEVREQEDELINKYHIGLLAIQNTFNKLNVPYDLEKCLQYQKSLLPFIPEEESEYLQNQIELLLEYEED